MSQLANPPQNSRPLRAVSPVSLSLSGEWCFAVGPDGRGEDTSWADLAFDDSEWVRVDVPHTWKVMPDYATYEGIAWYRRRFTPPPETGEVCLRLRFEAVFYLARAWLNGQYLGEHEGGYTPFEFDVSSLVKPGAENVIAVRVDNVRARNRLPDHLWDDGGIVRDVSLEVTGYAYIAGQRIVAVPRLAGVDEADTATVAVVVNVRNASTEPLEATLTGDIVDDTTGRSVLGAFPAAPVSVPARESAAVQLATTISSPRLWHFDHPHLYCWSASLVDVGGSTLHTHETTFGVRLVELKESRFYLNGEPMRLVGLSRHAGSPEHGLAETPSVMAADCDDLKRLNMVFARPVHYPQSEFILDYCDRNGILLAPEVPAWQLTAGQMADLRMRELEQQQLREMIDAGFNHPCIWAWSVGNELESDTADGRAFVCDMAAYTRSLDPTRPVSFASYHLLVGRPWADATKHADFVMMNEYFGTWHGPKDALGMALDTVHATWPEKTVVVSEFGFSPHWQKIEGPSSIDPEHYYIIPEDASPDSDEADAARRRVIGDQMAVFRSKPFVAGALHWCYQGAMGVVDDARHRRGSWWMLREEYSPVLFEAVTFSQATGGGQSVTVMLRTRGPLDEDMPVYTLRGYRLHWTATSLDGAETFSEGDLPLPVLAPEVTWSGEIRWSVPAAEAVLTLSVIRPTGFPVIERSYNALGEPVARIENRP